MAGTGNRPGAEVNSTTSPLPIITMTIDTNESIATAMEEATRPPDGTGTSTDIENSSATTTEPETSADNEARSRREPKECSCFPLGYYVAIPGLLATFGWFARLSQDGCDFARLTGPTVGEFISYVSGIHFSVGRINKQLLTNIYYNANQLSSQMTPVSHI